jgi:hypothetical protein
MKGSVLRQSVISTETYRYDVVDIVTTTVSGGSSRVARTSTLLVTGYRTRIDEHVAQHRYWILARPGR